MRTAHLFDRLDESINSFQHVFNMARIACDRLQLGTEYIVEFFNDLWKHGKQTSTDWVGLGLTSTKHIIGHIGMGFDGSNDQPTVSKHWRK